MLLQEHGGRGRCGESRHVGVGQCPIHGGCFQRQCIQSRRPLRGSSFARRCAGLGTAMNPGARASGVARPTGVVFSASASSREGPFVGRASLDAARPWAQRRIQERGRRAKPEPWGLFSAPMHPVARPLRGSSIARRCAGLGTAMNPGAPASGVARPTGVVFSANASSREGPFVGRASLDAARPWAQRRIQERRRRAKPEPRGLFSAPMHPVAKASSWVELRSTRRGLGHSDESRNAGVGRSPTHGGCFQRQCIQSRRPLHESSCSSTRRGLGHRGASGIAHLHVATRSSH